MQVLDTHPRPPLTVQFLDAHPRPPLTRGLAAQLTGGEIVPYFPETVSVSLAPSDEGAVNGVDWGREPGSVFPQRK